MTASFEATLDSVEKNIARISSPAKLSDFDHLVLTGQIELILFVSPLSELHKCQPNLNKIRKTWGRATLKSFIEKMGYSDPNGEKHKFINLISKEQLYFLLEGKELTEKL